MPKSSVQRTLKGLSIAFFLEALVMYGAAGAALWVLFTDWPNSIITVAALVLIALGAAIWLTFAAKAIRVAKRWARSAGIFWQIMQITVSFAIYDISVLGALAISLPSGAVLITLFTKEVAKAINENETED